MCTKLPHKWLGFFYYLKFISIHLQRTFLQNHLKIELFHDRLLYIDWYHFLNTKKVRDLESKSISSNKGINLTKPLDQILTGH